MEVLFNFLREHWVMSLATSGKSGPHSTPVFFAFQENPLHLFFLSDPLTHHMKDIARDPRVSAGIYLETKKIGLIRGSQIWGRAHIPSDPSQAASIYFKKFPHARLFHTVHPKHRFCILEVEKARLIDNRLGFGDKKEWHLKSSKD